MLEIQLRVPLSSSADHATKSFCGSYLVLCFSIRNLPPLFVCKEDGG